MREPTRCRRRSGISRNYRKLMRVARYTKKETYICSRELSNQGYDIRGRLLGSPWTYSYHHASKGLRPRVSCSAMIKCPFPYSCSTRSIRTQKIDSASCETGTSGARVRDSQRDTGRMLAVVYSSSRPIGPRSEARSAVTSNSRWQHLASRSKLIATKGRP